MNDYNVFRCGDLRLLIACSCFSSNAESSIWIAYIDQQTDLSPTGAGGRVEHSRRP